MLGPNRRHWIKGAATALGAAAVAPQLFAQSGPVKIGYAIARTGPWAAGAQVSQEPNYLLWAEQVNAAGGLSVKGAKRPIELIGYDDRSETETCVRTFEKLMGSDKVDLVLPPWGSGANFAVAPLANRFGYPLLAPTALSRKLIDMRLPFFFSLLQQPDKMMGALVDMLVANNVKTIAIVYMDDLFGLENFAALNNALKKTSIQVVERKSYPLGVKDLAPVALVGTGVSVLVVNAASPIDSLASLLATAKKKQLAYASSGNGTVGHLVAESLRVMAGANVLHIPYKGGGPAMTDLLGGQVDFYISSLVSALPLIKDRKLRALAVTSGTRDASLPEVPTFIESGFKGFEYYTLYGVVVPAKTPDNIVRTMNAEINKVLDSAEVRANLAARGVYVRTGTPEAFNTFLNSERKKWAEVVKASGATAE